MSKYSELAKSILANPKERDYSELIPETIRRQNEIDKHKATGSLRVRRKLTEEEELERMAEAVSAFYSKGNKVD